jgi:hypothetical protein
MYSLEEQRSEHRVFPPGANFNPQGRTSPFGASLKTGLWVTIPRRIDCFVHTYLQSRVKAAKWTGSAKTLTKNRLRRNENKIK